MKSYSGDFHSHTRNSDGELTVRELLGRAAGKNLSHYAITDHDCLDGAEEAATVKIRDEFPTLNVIYGIELSTELNDESVHILGYFPSSVVDALKPALDEQLERRRERAHRMFDLIEKEFGISLDRSEIYRRNSITRGTMGKMIAESSGYSEREAFDKIIGKDCPCYLPSTKLSTADGIALIHSCGGKAVLAHPCLLKKTDPNEIADFGVDGIEAVYANPCNNEGIYRELAADRKLFVSAGSDFHRISDVKHGDVGDARLTGDNLDRFLTEIYG